MQKMPLRNASLPEKNDEERCKLLYPPREVYPQKQGLLLLAQTLQVDKLEIPALLRQELGVRAALHDLALVEDVDHVGLLDSGQAVGDGNGSAALCGEVERCLHDLFGFGV